VGPMASGTPQLESPRQSARHPSSEPPPPSRMRASRAEPLGSIGKPISNVTKSHVGVPGAQGAPDLGTAPGQRTGVGSNKYPRRKKQSTPALRVREPAGKEKDGKEEEGTKARDISMIRATFSHTRQALAAAKHGEAGPTFANIANVLKNQVKKLNYGRHFMATMRSTAQEFQLEANEQLHDMIAEQVMNALSDIAADSEDHLITDLMKVVKPIHNVLEHEALQQKQATSSHAGEVQPAIAGPGEHNMLADPHVQALASNTSVDYCRLVCDLAETMERIEKSKLACLQSLEELDELKIDSLQDCTAQARNLIRKTGVSDPSRKFKGDFDAVAEDDESVVEPHLELPSSGRASGLGGVKPLRSASRRPSMSGVTGGSRCRSSLARRRQTEASLLASTYQCVELGCSPCASPQPSLTLATSISLQTSPRHSFSHMLPTATSGTSSRRQSGALLSMQRPRRRDSVSAIPRASFSLTVEATSLSRRTSACLDATELARDEKADTVRGARNKLAKVRSLLQQLHTDKDAFTCLLDSVATSELLGQEPRVGKSLGASGAASRWKQARDIARRVQWDPISALEHKLIKVAQKLPEAIRVEESSSDSEPEPEGGGCRRLSALEERRRLSSALPCGGGGPGAQRRPSGQVPSQGPVHSGGPDWGVEGRCLSNCNIFQVALSGVSHTASVQDAGNTFGELHLQESLSDDLPIMSSKEADQINSFNLDLIAPCESAAIPAGKTHNVVKRRSCDSDETATPSSAELKSTATACRSGISLRTVVADITLEGVSTAQRRRDVVTPHMSSLNVFRRPRPVDSATGADGSDAVLALHVGSYGPRSSVNALPIEIKPSGFKEAAAAPNETPEPLSRTCNAFVKPSAPELSTRRDQVVDAASAPSSCSAVGIGEQPGMRSSGASGTAPAQGIILRCSVLASPIAAPSVSNSPLAAINEATTSPSLAPPSPPATKAMHHRNSATTVLASKAAPLRTTANSEEVPKTSASSPEVFRPADDTSSLPDVPSPESRFTCSTSQEPAGPQIQSAGPVGTEASVRRCEWVARPPPSKARPWVRAMSPVRVASQSLPPRQQTPTWLRPAEPQRPLQVRPPTQGVSPKLATAERSESHQERRSTPPAAPSGEEGATVVGKLFSHLVKPLRMEVVSEPTNPLTRLCRPQGNARIGLSGGRYKSAAKRAALQGGRNAKLELHMWSWDAGDLHCDSACIVPEVPEVPDLLVLDSSTAPEMVSIRKAGLELGRTALNRSGLFGRAAVR